MSKQKAKKRKQRLKRTKRRKHRFDLAIKHFTECQSEAVPRGWESDKTGMHVEFVCPRCKLKYWRHNETWEYEIKGVGRISADSPNVLDLMTLG